MSARNSGEIAQPAVATTVRGADTASGANGDAAAWLCMRSVIVRISPRVAQRVERWLRAAAARLSGRLVCERWARLYFALDAAEPRPPDIALERVTESDIGRWHLHADRNEAQLRSGFRFWQHGLRHAYVWSDRGEPRCTVWLLTSADNPQLRCLPAWGGMYPPLRARDGRLENLFVFSDSRRSGVGTRFVRAVFAAASADGLTGLLTHIAERNEPARAHAARVGWRRYGTIARYQLDLPGVRALPLYLHLLEDGVTH